MNKKGSIVLYIYLLIQLILFDIELSMTGFNKTFNRYTQRYYKVKSTALNEENYQEVFNHIEGLFYIFDVVCAWYPRKADCIHKTLLGYKFLRKNIHSLLTWLLACENSHLKHMLGFKLIIKTSLAIMMRLFDITLF